MSFGVRWLITAFQYGRFHDRRFPPVLKGEGKPSHSKSAHPLQSNHFQELP